MKLARPPVLQLTIGERSARAEATQGDVTLWAGEAGYESPSDLALPASASDARKTARADADPD